MEAAGWRLRPRARKELRQQASALRRRWTLLKVSETPGAVPDVRGQCPVRWKTRGQCPNLGETGGNAQSLSWTREKHCPRPGGTSVLGEHKSPEPEQLGGFCRRGTEVRNSCPAARGAAGGPGTMPKYRERRSELCLVCGPEPQQPDVGDPRESDADVGGL